MKNGRGSVCQFRPEVGDVEANIEKVREISRKSEGEVHVYPELALSGYDLSIVEESAFGRDSEHVEKVKEISKEVDATIVIGFPEKDGKKLFNSALIVSPDGSVDIYRKEYPTGGERDTFSANKEKTVVETSAGKMGVLICYDMSFPETMIEYGNRRCDFVAVISAWRNGWHDDWRLLSRSRALENNCYVVSSNQMGSQNGRFNDGESLIASPYANILLNLKQEKRHGTVEIDKEVIENSRNYNPVVDDRRED